MWRVILIFAAVLVVADTTGALSEADGVACTDEADGRQCPPTCPACTCAWYSLSTALALGLEVQPVRLPSLTVELAPPSAAHGQLAPPPTTRPPIV